MLYLGYINFASSKNHIEKLKTSLQSFTKTPPSIIQKGNLALAYGKLQSNLDLDKVWENKSAILLGRIFNKESNKGYKSEDFESLEINEVSALSRWFWGKYVCFSVNEAKSIYTINLDRTGQLPCFYHRYPDGNIVLSSSIDILYHFLGCRPEFNWNYLCSYLVYGNSSSIQSPFTGISEVPPACKLEVTKDSIQTLPNWDPFGEYESRNLQSLDPVQALDLTLSAWIEPYQNVYVSLSGGLDSSAIAYCARGIIHQNQTLRAVNYYHSGLQSSNEVEQARRVCEDTGIELIEIDARQSLPFDAPNQANAFHPNKPVPGLISRRWSECIFDSLCKENSFTFISGHGSDHIFMRPPTKKSLSDLLLERGFMGFSKTLKQIAHFYRDPVLPILSQNLSSIVGYYFGRKYKKRDIHDKLVDIPDWFSKSLLKNLSDDYIHPIYEVLPSKVLPGKYEQIDAFYEGLASIHLDFNENTDPTFYPYLYEPIVGLALSYPTYSLFDHGYDRYPLRESASKKFNTKTVWRRDKSQTTGIFQLGLKKNFKSIAELCLEGQFAKQALIDRDGFYKTINLISNGDNKNMWPIIQLVSSEMFIKYWGQ